MSLVFKFRMLSDEDEHFIRDYELSYDNNLLDFHNLICKDLGYDEMEMASFFLSDSSWQKLREFTLFDMGFNGDEMGDETPIPMEQILLGNIIHNKYERLLYVFDLMEDRAYFVELMEAKRAEDGVTYPIMAFSHGDAPDQFDADQSKPNNSIFDEAMGGFEDFEGDEYYDDEY